MRHETHERWFRVSSPAWIWHDSDLRVPSRFHESGCLIDPIPGIESIEARCTCRSPVEVLPAGTLVAVLDENGIAARVSVLGYLPFWVERRTLEATNRKISDDVSSSGMPSDYVDWVEAGSPVVSARIRRPPVGGGIVFVRSEMKDRASPWRWIGTVRVGGELCYLLVDPSIPLDQVFDANEEQIRTIPFSSRSAVHALIPFETDR